MEHYFSNNLITIPIEISFDNSTKNLKFPKKWSSIKTIEESKDLFESYKLYKSVALLTGKINNITVIDIDNMKSWNTLKIVLPDNTLRVQTNRGLHLYFKYEESLKTLSNIIEGIDVRNDGGNIIIPPSEYALSDGKVFKYEYINNTIETAINMMKNLPKIPDTLLTKLNDSINKPQSIKIELPIDTKISKLKKILSNFPDNFYSNFGNLVITGKGIIGYLKKDELKAKNLFIFYCKKGKGYSDEYEKIWNEIDEGYDINHFKNIIRNCKLNNIESDFFDKDILIGILKKKKDLLIDYINRHFAVITSNDNGKVIFCELEYKNNRISKIIFILSKENFLSKIPDDIKIEITDDKFKSVNKFWLESSNRNEYRKTVFEPGISSYGNLNMFLGFNYLEGHIKVNESKFKYIYRHIKEVICNNEDKSFNYLLDWISYILQFPTKRMGVAIVCKSVQGVGKNLFFENFIGNLIIGKNHGICISDTDQIVGKFNSILEKMIYTVVNELKADGDIIKMSNLLKSLITDSTQKIEKKGIDAIHINNYNNFIFLSNNHNVVNVEMYDRRYFCLSASSKYVNNKSYFNTLVKNMLDDEISEMFFNYLMNRDLSNFDFRDIPLTEYKKELIYNSIPSIMKWFNEYIKECLNSNKEDCNVKLSSLCDKYKEYSMTSRLNIGNFKRQLIDKDKGVSCIDLDITRNECYVIFNTNDVKNEMESKSIWYNY